MAAFGGSRKKTYTTGIVRKKLPHGQWLVSMDGRNIIAVPQTDEPIELGSRVRLAAVGSFVQKPMILGAAR